MAPADTTQATWLRALATTTVANVYETSARSLAERPEVDDFGLWTIARRLATAIQRANAEVIDVAKKTEKYAKVMGNHCSSLSLLGRRGRCPRGARRRQSLLPFAGSGD